MNGNNNNQSLDNELVLELLKKGLIVGSFTAGGTFVLGGVSGIICTAIGLILAFIDRAQILSAYDRISALSGNILVRLLLSITPHLSQLPWERIWQSLVRVVKLLSSLSPSGSGKILPIAPKSNA